MQALVGGLIPVSETILASWKIATVIVTLAVVAVAAALLHPSNPDKIVESSLPKPAPAEGPVINRGIVTTGFAHQRPSRHPPPITQPEYHRPGRWVHRTGYDPAQ